MVVRVRAWLESLLTGESPDADAELDSGEVHEGQQGRGEIHEIRGQALGSTEPGEGPFNNQPPFDDLEADSGGIAADDLEPQTIGPRSL